MKQIDIKLIALALLAAALTGCATGQAASKETRVDGQRAREAGLQDDRFKVKRSGELQQPAKGATVAQATPSLQPAPAPTPVEATQTGDIELKKEEFIVGKREVPNGGVRLRTVVQTEQVSQPIDLRREEYVIERLATHRDVANPSFEPREVYLSLSKEEAVSGKRAIVTEVIRVRKEVHVDKPVVSGTVRKEVVEVVKTAP